MLLGFSLFAFAQGDKKSDMQVEVQAGASLPLSDYKKVPFIKTAYNVTSSSPACVY